MPVPAHRPSSRASPRWYSRCARSRALRAIQHAGMHDEQRPERDCRDEGPRQRERRSDGGEPHHGHEGAEQEQPQIGDDEMRAIELVDADGPKAQAPGVFAAHCFSSARAIVT